MALLVPFRGVAPRIAPDAFLAPTAVVIGDVTIGPEASVWFGAVLRGDNPGFGIDVGARTNIQDNCVVHVGDWQPTVIGADVTIGHGAKFESCTIEDRCVIGMNAVILQEAVIGAGSLVAANAVVLEGTKVPPGSLAAGVPAQVRKSLEGSSSQFVGRSGTHYVDLSREYLAQGIGGLGDTSDQATACARCGGPVLEGEGVIHCLHCGHTSDAPGP